MGSPINNRALFPCQEPPVAMSTWQATVRAAASFVVLMSGENSAKPTPLRDGTVHVFYLGVMHTLDPGTHQLCYSLWGSSFPSEVGTKPCQMKTGLAGRATWESGHGVLDSLRQHYQFIVDSRVTLTWWFVEQSGWSWLKTSWIGKHCHGNTLELSCVCFGCGIYMWLPVFPRGSTQASQLAGLGNLNPGRVRDGGKSHNHLGFLHGTCLFCHHCPFDIFSMLMPGNSTIY